MGKRGKFILGLGGLNIFLLGLVSLLNDFSSELVAPLLPLFIASLGGTGITIGIIGGLMMGLPSLLKVVSGYFSDKIRNRRKFIFWGYFTSEFFKLMLFFAKSASGVMIFMGFNKLGKGIREAPRDALISESMPQNKGKAFGIQRAFDVTGAILGSLTLLAIVLFFGISTTDEFFFRTILLFSAIVGFISLIPLFFLREVKNVKKQKKIKTLYVSLNELPFKLKFFLFISGIFALANFSYMFFILRAQNIFGIEGDGLAVTLALYVLFNIFYSSMAIPFGKLFDRIGRRIVMVRGYLLFSVVCLGFLLFNSILAYSILFILYGLVYAMVVGNQNAFVSDLSSPETRATAIGFFQTVIGICAIVSGIVAGLLYDLSSNFTFIYGFSLSLLSVVLFWVFGKVYKQNNSIPIKGK